MREDADDREALVAYLTAACADEPELLATVLALADAGEVGLLRVVRDFRDNVSERELRTRHADLDESLRLIHRIYVDSARRARERGDRPLRARKCYEARMLARRDNYQAMLDDAGEAMPDAQRSAFAALVGCARDKVPYDALPARLGGDAAAVQEEVLRLRLRFKEWSARRKARADGNVPGGVCDG